MFCSCSGCNVSNRKCKNSALIVLASFVVVSFSVVKTPSKFDIDLQKHGKIDKFYKLM